MRKRRIKKLNKSEHRKILSKQILTCDTCKKVKIEVRDNIVSVTCSLCLVKEAGFPEVSVKSDKPRGWHFMEYFEYGGVVYSKGQVITDKKQISKLKRANKAKLSSVIAENSEEPVK